MSDMELGYWSRIPFVGPDCCPVTKLRVTLSNPWTVGCEASLSSTFSCSLLRFMATELVMLSNLIIPLLLFSFCLQPFPASESFPMSQLFAIGGPSIGVSTSASVLPMTIQDWFPLGWTGLISLQSILIHRSNQGSEETEEEWTLMSSRDREKLLPGHMYLLLWSLKHCCLSTWVLLALETLINEAQKKVTFSCFLSP